MTRLDPETADLHGLTVIEASAGTGKTFAVQKIVARLVREGVPVQRLLVMSYTNAAADELAERIRRELEAALVATPVGDICARGRLERALADLDLAQVSTIHGFCQRMLREHPAEAGVHGLDGWTLETDGAATLRRCCDEAWSALVEQSAVLDGLVRELGAVRTLTRQADGNESMRTELQRADLSGATGALRAAADELAAAGELTALAEAAAVLKVAFSRPAQSLCQALGQLGAGASSAERLWSLRETIAGACEALLDDEMVEDALPARPGAAKRAAVEAAAAFLASDAWTSLRRGMRRFADASHACVHAAERQVATEALRRLDARRHALRQVNFDGLIRRLRDAVREPGSAMVEALRARFEVVIVDEVQDTDPAQAEILRRAFIESPRHRVILVGDPKQSIYRFRNADLDSYLALRGLCMKPVLRLDRSHRSDASLVRAVQALYAVPDPFLRAEIPMAEVDSAHPHPRLLRSGAGGPGLVLHHPVQGQDAIDPLRETACSIVRTLHEGWRVPAPDGDRPLRPGDIAVLCHAHWQGAIVARHLRELGVPVMVVSRSSVFASEAAQDVARVLAAVAQPGSRSLALGAMACRVMGMQAGDAVARPDAWLRRLRTCEADLRAHGVELALRRLVDDAPEGAGRRGVLASEGGERYAVDFDHVLEELQAAESSGVRGPAALADWLARSLGEQGGEDAVIRAAGDGDAVTLMTIHGSKGLDFGLVWLPTFMAGDAGDAQDRAEPRRLLYVALTRARHRTHVIWRPGAPSAASPLASLLHGAGVTPDEMHEHVSARLESVTAIDDLHAVAMRAEPGDVEVRAFDTTDPPAWPPQPRPDLVAARPMPDVPPRAVMLSFTSLTHARDRHDVAAERDVAGPDTPRPVRRADGAGPFDAEVGRSGLRGTALGILVHDALAEHDAFAALAAGADRAPLVSALRRHGAGLRWRKDASIETLAQALAQALAAPSGVDAIPSVQSLAAEPRRTLRELAIAVPWGAKPSDLAQILRDERQPWSDAVADAVARSDERILRGLLVGNIDLAAERDGRWFILDYKTNDLGGDPDLYEPQALHAAMAAALYPLQAAIYAAMLARWVWIRGGRRGDVADSIGGVAYLFVRGMNPQAGARGTWTWLPSRSLLHAMHAALPMPDISAVGVP